ncbi:MAG: NADH-quinone oxidoreductase subunit M [bacterium]|jgi:NADH-quinone oxidoreductase subunit M
METGGFFDALYLFFINPLNQTVFLPLFGAIALLFFPKEKPRVIKGFSLVVSILTFLLSLQVLRNFSPDLMNWQFDVEWIPLMRVHYYIGIDGLSMPLFLLTSFICLLAMIGSFSITFREKEYFVLYFILVFAMLGVFVALDYFLFYIFWEIMLVPMYFLIAIWGGPRKEYAAIKFFLYTLFGSVFMLICIIGMFIWAGAGSWKIDEIANSVGLLYLTELPRTLLFIGLLLGFAIKVPMFPFHTWLPDAHVEAPTAISVILAGVLLKMGTYGFLRIAYPTFPDIAKNLGPVIAFISIIAIIYGALVAMAQADLKKLIAYSSVSHMGYMTLGIATLGADGINGAILQMCAHGLSTGALFLLVGVIYDRAHTRLIADFGGLYNQMPQYTGMMSLAAFTSLGLPGLVGFWGEFLILKGTFMAPEVWENLIVFGGVNGIVFFRWMAVIAAIGMILTAGYLLWMIERVFLGKANARWDKISDMSVREWWSLAPAGVLMVALGVYPAPLMNLFSQFSAVISARLAA